MKSARLHIVLGSLVLLWLAGVFALYYAWHKPFSAATAVSLGSAIWNLGAALALVSLAGGLGGWLLREVDLPPLMRIAVQFALGLGLLSIAVLLVGAIVGTHPLAAWIGLVLPGILLRKHILGWWKSWKGVGILWLESSAIGKTLGLLTALILSFTLLLALAPPLKFDALVYHLSLPASYIAAGRIGYLPWNFFWGMPQLGEMLNLWSMLLAGETSAACLGWGVGVIALAGLLGYCQHRFGTDAAWVGTASLLAGYTTASALAWGYAEWHLILFGLALLAALQTWLDSSQRRWLYLAGIFAGFAFSSKYTGGALMLAGAVTVVWHGSRRQGLRRMSLDAVGFLMAGAAAASPWLVKNIIATGNPFYPFLLPAAAVDAFRLSIYQGLAVWGDWREAAFLPVRATFLGFEGAPGFAASVGPLLLGLTLLYPLRRLLKIAHELPSAGAAVPLAILAWIIWGLASRFSGLLVQTRLFMSFFPAFALLSSGGYRLISVLRLPGVRLVRVAGALIILAMALNAVQIGSDLAAKRALPVLIGVDTRDSYLFTNLGWYYPAMQAIGDLPDGSRVVMLWEPRSLYCLPRCDPDEVLDRWLVEMNAHSSAGEIAGAFRLVGFSHLLINQTGADFVRGDDARYSPQQWAVLDELLASMPPPQQIGGGYSLYRLNP